jgi:hypothetical protein
MGYYASSDWELTIPTKSIEPLKEELMALDNISESIARDLSVEQNIVKSMNEDADAVVNAVPGDDAAIEITGWGSGKCWEDSSIYDVIAKYATGTVDWLEEGDGSVRWRVRFLGNGIWERHNAEVIVRYPTDPLD